MDRTDLTPTEQFAAALQQLESDRDLDAFTAQFTDDAELVRPETGRAAGAREFWQAYLDQFEQVRSEFSRVVQDGRLGELEWRATGRLRTGREIEYAGVSLLELDGDRVRRFATWYDTAAFLLTPS